MRNNKVERRSGQDRRQQTDRRKKVQEAIEEKRFDDQIEGRNSVLELLESGKDINKIYVTRGEKHGSINKILGIAKERKIIVVEKDRGLNFAFAIISYKYLLWFFFNGIIIKTNIITFDIITIIFFHPW